MKITNPKGAGRPLRYSEKSVVLSINVPASKKEYIKKLFNRYLTKHF